MQSNGRSTWLLMATLAFSANCSARNDLTVGQRYSGSEELESRLELGRGSPDYVLNYFKTYAGDNERVITQIIIEDVADDGALAALVAGGPGHTFATLSYTIPRRGHMSFNVTLYGKPAPFRKIP